MYKSNRRQFFAFAGLGAAALALGTPARHALAGPDDSKAGRLPSAGKIARLVSPEMRKVDIPGLVVGLSHHGHRAFHGFGKSGAAVSGPPDANTVFEIGSITKTMTGLLLARAMIDDGLELSAPINESLPQGYALSDAGQAITWLDLATHTSGLPTIQDNLTGTDAYNPFLGYTEDMLKDYLAHIKLLSHPGERWLYSNIGAGLVGWLLAKAKGVSYESLLQERVLDPLGLFDSSITLHGDQSRRLAQGHDTHGSPRPVWELPVIQGAGAVRSTAKDLLGYAEGYLLGRTSPLGLAMAQAISPRMRKSDDPGLFMGLFWLIKPTKEGEILCHAGKSGSMNTFVAFQPKTSTAVVLLANKAPEQDVLTDLAFTLLKMTSELTA